MVIYFLSKKLPSPHFFVVKKLLLYIFFRREDLKLFFSVFCVFRIFGIRKSQRTKNQCLVTWELKL